MLFSKIIKKPSFDACPKERQPKGRSNEIETMKSNIVTQTAFSESMMLEPSAPSLNLTGPIDDECDLTRIRSPCGKFVYHF